MDEPTNLQIFYHIAAMGDWQQVVLEQFDLLAEVGLTGAPVFCTFVGIKEGIAWSRDEARRRGIDLDILQSDPNIMHFETFAMLAIERWARASAAPAVLYFHTKGVSAPGHDGKRRWRHLMQDQLIRRWREHLVALENHDVIGVNWRGHPFPPHFCGNFWMATCAYLQTLEDFATFHGRNNLERTNCEFWIGASSRSPEILSLVDRDADYCSTQYFG